MQNVQAKIWCNAAQASVNSSRIRTFRANYAGNAVHQLLLFSHLAYVLASALSDQAKLRNYGRKILATAWSVLLVFSGAAFLHESTLFSVFIITQHFQLFSMVIHLVSLTS